MKILTPNYLSRSAGLYPRNHDRRRSSLLAAIAVPVSSPEAPQASRVSNDLRLIDSASTGGIENSKVKDPLARRRAALKAAPRSTQYGPISGQ
jgi:hypothetical protein